MATTIKRWKGPRDWLYLVVYDYIADRLIFNLVSKCSLAFLVEADKTKHHFTVGGQVGGR